MASEYYKWNHDKNLKLKEERNINFEKIVMHIERGDVLDIVAHPNREKYPNQKIFIINIDNYAYIVPFVEENDYIFLKTIIPSRKATRNYIERKQYEYN